MNADNEPIDDPQLERTHIKLKASEAISLHQFRGMSLDDACELVAIDRDIVEEYMARDCRGLKLDPFLPTLTEVYAIAARIRPHDREPVSIRRTFIRVGEPRVYGFDSWSKMPVAKESA